LIVRLVRDVGHHDDALFRRVGIDTAAGRTRSRWRLREKDGDYRQSNDAAHARAISLARTPQLRNSTTPNESPRARVLDVGAWAFIAELWSCGVVELPPARAKVRAGGLPRQRERDVDAAGA